MVTTTVKRRTTGKPKGARSGPRSSANGNAATAVRALAESTTVQRAEWSTFREIADVFDALSNEYACAALGTLYTEGSMAMRALTDRIGTWAFVFGRQIKALKRNKLINTSANRVSITPFGRAIWECVSKGVS